MTLWSRRHALGALGAAALCGTARAERFAGHYQPQADLLADGVWVVRGSDAPIGFDNGGAIANSVILASEAGPILFDCGPSQRYGADLSALARRLTGKAPALVLISHLHPDHALGASAFDPALVGALPGTIADIERDEPGMSDAMFRMLADWMRDTRLVLPGRRLAPGALTIGGRRLTLYAMRGHSGCDLVVKDEQSGVLLAGDLVFHDRAPATPHADLAQWRASLDQLSAIPHGLLVPGHGPVDRDGSAIAQTRDWLTWLDGALHQAAAQGLDMTEAGDMPIPARFAAMAAARYELQRSVSHFYPAIEAALLPRIDG
ncbi:quinoprotein relay system zinc metallohydrolase 1 [Novosphingobium sp. Fuku2-ISO-50]|uniref:quinoprotein relay system zinc metallohydrolase 1 n=1 Tax=Novosphingobium sp. Fuku2-ISO-50 TaxID=1739114 RepID=UPI00076C2F90|nr:quinoprotein relay system zinc metallohydrolase 1 [Novosphingobium sp. Fuku2-ISO-50]KUR78334.1 hydrolase [Novosphingobium sp. Fuku2-ISO-50]